MTRKQFHKRLTRKLTGVKRVIKTAIWTIREFGIRQALISWQMTLLLKTSGAKKVALTYKRYFKRKEVNTH